MSSTAVGSSQNGHVLKLVPRLRRSLVPPPQEQTGVFMMMQATCPRMAARCAAARRWYAGPPQHNCIIGSGDPLWLRMMIGDSIRENPKWFIPNDPEVTSPHVARITDVAESDASDAEPTADDSGNRERKLPPSSLDRENGKLLKAVSGRDIRYLEARKDSSWLVWDGARWKRDSGLEIQRRCIKALDTMLTMIAATDDTELRTKLESRWRQSNRRARIAEMQYFCSSLDGVAIDRTKLDVDPRLFNCANGTIYLPSSERRDARRDDLITRISPVAYKPGAQAPRFLQFLRELFPRNPDTIDYLQRLAGYSMTGETKDHVLILLYGRDGRNGKTTLLEALLSVMGLREYGTVTSASTFAVKRGGGIPNDLAKVALYRFVSVPEIDRTQSLNESLVKDVTGASTTTARFLYEEEFEFKPTFKIWMATNEMPKTSGGAPISARLVTIPFNVSFLGREDKELPGKLAEECEGILAWMVEGARLWYRDGLGAAPSSVTALRENYRSTMDALSDFESSRLAFGESLRASYAALDDAYQGWCRDMGVTPLYGKSQLVGELMSRNLNLTKGKSGDVRQLRGVGLKSPDSKVGG